MRDDSCLRGVGSNPGALYWMDVFSHWFVERIVLFVWKTKHKRKSGRGWLIFKKHSSLKDIYLCLHSKWPTIMEFFKCLEEKKCYHTKSMDGVNLLFVWVQWPQVVSWLSEMACIEMAFSASVFVLTISGPHIISRIIKVGNFISLVRSVQYS